MRMWNVEPQKMCDQHILGEHVECHMFVGCINKNKSLKGYVNKGLVEVHNIKKRHDELAKEMKIRGMNHKSKLPTYDIITLGKINSAQNNIELTKRCPDCRKRLK
jgi:hypothetical protein